MMPTRARMPVGWYLGLPHMNGVGLVPCLPEKITDHTTSVDFIFADEVLLDTPDWRDLLSDWWQALGSAGKMVLWLPDCRYSRDADAKAYVVADDLKAVFDSYSGWQQDEDDIIDGHIFLVYEKRNDARHIRTPWRKQSRHCLVARSGGYGDGLVAASVLPALKDEGWHISFLAKPAVAECIRHDPHIDQLIEIGDAQVPDDAWPLFWKAWSARFDRFINLTHSIEGELLKRPLDQDYYWSDEQRRALCNESYLKRTHQLAGVGGPYRPAFYPSTLEKAAARSYASRTGPFILWHLRGSAQHKWWPYGPQATCQILAQTDAHIVFTGDSDATDLANALSKAVDAYHGDQSRVHFLVGTQSIRFICALAQVAQLVVGPETGVMHAVAMEKMPKIVFLSHSSRANLTDDWINATALTGSAACAPCHRLHYDHSCCPIDEVTGAAQCAATIAPKTVVTAVRIAWQKREKE